MRTTKLGLQQQKMEYKTFRNTRVLNQNGRGVLSFPVTRETLEWKMVDSCGQSLL
ncbi:MAG: hypothetical protein WB988_13035 [Candidatus Nitrosopolaris sp.]